MKTLHFVKLGISLLTVLSMIAGCESIPPRPAERDSASIPRIADNAIHFVRSRSLEIEPCGCTVANGGGANREFNLAEIWKGQSSAPVLNLTGGHTFVPFAALSPSQSAVKREALAKAMKLLAVDYVSPSVKDLDLSRDELTRLSQLGGFRYVQSSFRAKGKPSPLLQNHAVWTGKNGTKVVVVALSSQPTSVPADYQFLSPRKALDAVVSEVGNIGPAHWVLVSQLNDVDLASIVQRRLFHLVLDTHCGGATYDPKLIAPHTLAVCPVDRGREAARIALSGVPGGLPYNEVIDDRIRDRLREIQYQSEKLAAEKPRPAIANAKLREYRAESEALSKKVVANPSGGTRFDFEIEWLGSRFELPANPVSQVVDAYRKTIHDNAIAAGK